MEEPPPFYRSPSGSPSILTMLRHAISDPAATISDSIYEDWSVQLPGPAAPLVISHPEAVREVLLDKGERFGRNRQLRLLMRRAWGEGLAGAEGEAWARQRQAASPAFRPQAVAAATAAIARVARSRAATWPTDRPIELGAAIGRIVAEVVMTTLIAGLDEAGAYDRLAADIPPLVREVTTFGALDLLPFSDATLDRIRGLGRSASEARLRALAERIAASADAPHRLPALLRGAGPLPDNMLGFMIAGFETTALAAAWAMYLLARYPAWQGAVRHEAVRAPAADAGGGLPLARRVAQEAMRLYPPAPLLARAAMVPLTLRGHRLRAGQPVLIPVYAIHRHRRLWRDPDAFDPDRFGPDASHERMAYLPFGAGPRLCIAASFALAEVAVIVAELVKAFDFACAAPAPEVSLRITTHSLTGLNVRARPVGGG